VVVPAALRNPIAIPMDSNTVLMDAAAILDQNLQRVQKALNQPGSRFKEGGLLKFYVRHLCGLSLDLIRCGSPTEIDICLLKFNDK
jgi:hypothetical protein